MTNEEFLQNEIEETLGMYRTKKSMVQEHVRLEEQAEKGGYEHRQIYEVVQNGADQIKRDESGKITVILSETSLYCANEGAPFTKSGIRCLLQFALSTKTGNEIGHFGIGFKSLLGICDHPQVFSRTINFAFNPPGFISKVRKILRDEKAAVPKMRGAELLDKRQELLNDPILDELLREFTTVIRAPLKEGARSQLAKDIVDFPAEFLLFCPHVSELTLWDQLRPPRRLTLKRKGKNLRLSDGDESQEWFVCKKELPASDLPTEAYEDIDKLTAQRKQFAVYWAVPRTDMKRQTGRFWAFFPTKTETTLQGILNAPWKTNNDRENLLEGPFNDWLLKHASDLVCSHLKFLNTPEDPACFLDVLPGRYSKNDFDRSIQDHVLNTLRKSKCIPCKQTDASTSGEAEVELVIPGDAKLLPEDYGDKAVSSWIEGHPDLLPTQLAHAMVHSRRAVATWLGCSPLACASLMVCVQAKCKTATDSIASIQLARALRGVAYGDERAKVEGNVKVLTANETWVYPDKDAVAFAAAKRSKGTLVDIVHSVVAENQEARKFLIDTYGIESISSDVEFRAFWKARTSAEKFWTEFWTLSRGLEPDIVQSVIDASVKVKTLAGTFQDLGDVLLPGRIFSDKEKPPINEFVIDTVFHKKDLGLLDTLQASDIPRVVSPRSTALSVAYSELARTHLKDARSFFMNECQKREGQTKPRESSSAGFNEGTCSTILPLEPLRILTNATAVNYTSHLIQATASAESIWKIVHRTRPDTYPHVPFPSLAAWVIQNHGWVDTSVGAVRCVHAVSQSFNGLSTFFPVISLRPNSELALLSLPATAQTLRPEHWNAALERALRFECVDAQELVRFYAWMSDLKRPRPTTLRCRIGGQWDIAEAKLIRVTDDIPTMERLAKEKIPYLYSPVTNDVQRLAKWLTREIAWDLNFETFDEPVSALERFPQLRDAGSFLKPLRLQCCSKLWQEHRDSGSGLKIQGIEGKSLVRDNCLYFVGERDPRWILEAICRHFPQIPDHIRDEILQSLDAAALRKLTATIRKSAVVEDKVLLAIGEEALRGGIHSRHLVRYERDGQLDGSGLSKLAMAVHGTDILKFYAKDLCARGLNAPLRWAGGVSAIRFVRELGFEDVYAGLPPSERRPFEDVLGPSTLGPLHKYQIAMRDEIIRALIQEQPGRGMLSLPTGAGKTRVAVQSIVEWFIQKPSKTSTALWIAQSDELCEQAVQCWLQVWRSCGPSDEQLRVNRLWGSTNDRIERPNGCYGVVVATYQSLVKRIERQDLNWLFEPDVVVIDEAHGATASSYTSILTRLGFEPKSTSRPLIGLSATPFRGGKDETDTVWLACRFDRKRFDQAFADDSEDLYKKLQRMTVLANVDHDELAGDDIALTAIEQKELAAAPNWLPRTVESRLASDESRNERILAHIREQPSDWPILLFAINVEHAEDLAVQLSMEGITARSVSGETSTDSRRLTIAAFNRGEIRVLTNYGVLTTGFDAPKVRAVYITRPVFSKALYQQMVGRGLRGPMNGGKDRCLIVNVADNIREYGYQLAFREFEHVWRP